MQLPAQAFVCSLADVSPKGGVEWSEEVISLFSDLTLEKQLIACVKFKGNSLFFISARVRLTCFRY